MSDLCDASALRVHLCAGIFAPFHANSCITFVLRVGMRSSPAVKFVLIVYNRATPLYLRQFACALFRVPCARLCTLTVLVLCTLWMYTLLACLSGCFILSSSVFVRIV